jgi:hypothetical protein
MLPVLLFSWYYYYLYYGLLVLPVVLLLLSTTTYCTAPSFFFLLPCIIIIVVLYFVLLQYCLRSTFFFVQYCSSQLFFLIYIDFFGIFLCTYWCLLNSYLSYKTSQPVLLLIFWYSIFLVLYYNSSCLVRLPATSTCTSYSSGSTKLHLCLRVSYWSSGTLRLLPGLPPL